MRTKRKVIIELHLFSCLHYAEICICAGPWNDFSGFEMSMRFIENKDTLCYIKGMRIWYVEMYKDDKFLYTPIIIVYLNDNSEYDRGNPI
jgi:hypothetical protein